MNIRQLVLPITWKLSYEKSEYVVTDCNRYAFEWLEKWPIRIHENFVCLTGECGSGKSHLAYLWAKRVGAEIISCKTSIPNSLFNLSCDIGNKRFFVIDDADNINEDVLLFCFYNTIKINNAYALFVSKEPPVRWNIKLADVKSRLFTMSVLNIKNPSESAMQTVIFEMFKQRGIIVQNSIITMIMNNIERSYASIVNLVNAIDVKLLNNNKLNKQIIKQILDKTS